MQTIIILLLIVSLILFSYKLHVKLSNINKKIDNLKFKIDDLEVPSSIMKDNLILNQLNSMTTQFIAFISILIAILGIISYEWAVKKIETITESHEVLSVKYLKLKTDNIEIKTELTLMQDRVLTANEILLMTETTKFEMFLKDEFYSEEDKTFDVYSFKKNIITFYLAFETRKMLLEKYSHILEEKSFENNYISTTNELVHNTLLVLKEKLSKHKKQLKETDIQSLTKTLKLIKIDLRHNDEISNILLEILLDLNTK